MKKIIILLMVAICHLSAFPFTLTAWNVEKVQSNPFDKKTAHNEFLYDCAEGKVLLSDANGIKSVIFKCNKGQFESEFEKEKDYSYIYACVCMYDKSMKLVDSYPSAQFYALDDIKDICGLAKCAMADALFDFLTKHDGYVRIRVSRLDFGTFDLLIPCINTKEKVVPNI